VAAGANALDRVGSTFNYVASGQYGAAGPNKQGFAALADDVRQGWNSSATNSYGQEYTRLLDPGMTDAAFEDAKKNSAVFNITSGSIDLMRNLYGADPANLAFAGGSNIIKANRLAITGTNRAELTAKIDTGVTVALPSKARQAAAKIFSRHCRTGQHG